MTSAPISITRSVVAIDGGYFGGEVCISEVKKARVGADEVEFIPITMQDR